MPIGLFVLLFLSVLIFRRARRVGRSGLAWIAWLWLATFGVAIAINFACMIGILLWHDWAISAEELRSALHLPSAVGMIAGAAFAMSRAGRTWTSRWETNSDA
ncbi:hypothetical protein [Allorhodopirellula heiligendammensis]|uniref:Uncharacterized protein n=1 Tax=Allorhodopirellula heiligendammensis TaxID=2714739 RepID=A0A5C6BYK5_9BACT|nr:hypothetical protein [Allorhodopirellula heiligendammensis]TWU16541.1 hypothetical protein Poly21_37460 [Allorhodopirellula heiligendammensis]